MLKSLLLNLLLVSSLLANAQTNKNLDAFYEILTPENLDSVKNSMVERNGNVITLKDFSYSGKEYTFIKCDITKMKEIRWTTKEEYDDLYPEDAPNSDAKHITIFMNEGTVERDTYWTSNDKKEYKSEAGSTHRATICENCDFISFSFINSELASKAKKLLDAYQDEMKK
jgi:hypothetical protein